jgi:septal ring factor EnvC (AmiA/AmiB activator)
MRTAREVIDRMQGIIDQLRAKIERMEAGRHKQDKRENGLRDRVAQLEQDVAALEAALDRKVSECLRWQQQARPLLTEAEDEAGTRAMVDLELRGNVW